MNKAFKIEHNNIMKGRPTGISSSKKPTVVRGAAFTNFVWQSRLDRDNKKCWYNYKKFKKKSKIVHLKIMTFVYKILKVNRPNVYKYISFNIRCLI